jgi:lipoate-protein ligase B
MDRPGWLLNLDQGITPYADAWELQKALVGARQRGAIADGLILLEHEPVFTIGRSTKAEHLLFPREMLARQGFGVFDIERGGSITYHGPGQLVGYPILDLRAYNEDIVTYMRSLEETVLRTLADFAISAERVRAFPGVWVGGEKIGAVGVAVRRKVTMHGFALNVDPDLSHFALINPCGLSKPVTSMARMLGRPVRMALVRAAYRRRVQEIYRLALEPVTEGALLEQIVSAAVASTS